MVGKNVEALIKKKRECTEKLRIFEKWAFLIQNRISSEAAPVKKARFEN